MNNHDKLIKQVFFNSSGRLNGRRTDKILANKYPNIAEYLDNRYSDSTFLRETLLRIYFDIEVRPVCLNCGKPVEFIGKKKKMYASFCCCKCNSIYHDLGHKWQLTQQKYNLEHYGVKYNFQVEKFKKKRTETLLEKYGVEHPLSNKEISAKYRNTCKKHYGVESPMKSKIIKDKIWATMKANNSFKKSKAEDTCYELLSGKFGKDDVVRQYKCELYPWHCDFYIKPLDLFIEYQGYYTHGDHPFDPNNEDDIDELNKLKVKYKPYYNEYKEWPQSITIWTEKDVEKRNTAKKNKLNYLEFYSLDEVEKWIKLQTKK